MSCLKRAQTWEISDSESERENKSVKLNQEEKCTEKKKRRRREELKEEREQKLQEQLLRKETTEKINLLKPENIIKSLTVHIHAVLLQEAGCDVLLNTLDGLAWRKRIEDQGLRNSIRWTRQTLQKEKAEEDDENKVVEEDQVLMVISQNEFEDIVTSHKGISQLAPIGDVKEEAESLFQHLCEHLNRASGKFVTILVIDQHQRRGGSWKEFDVDSHENLETEELLVHLQLYWNVAIHFLFGWKEVTDHVIAVTKALSKRPYKALCDVPQLGFCIDGSWSGGVRVDRDGRGLAQVWTRQIQQLNRVSVPTAKAVTTAYPSPSLLLQAYEELPDEEERRRLLADLTVRGGVKERRVGPDISGRIHRLLTSSNPHLLLD